MTITCSIRMTTRTPVWLSASSSAALSRWSPRSWRRPGFRARTPICSSSTTSREISQSTACSVGGGDPSSPMRRSCSASIPKGACRRFPLFVILMTRRALWGKMKAQRPEFEVIFCNCLGFCSRNRRSASASFARRRPGCEVVLRQQICARGQRAGLRWPLAH